MVVAPSTSRTVRLGRLARPFHLVLVPDLAENLFERIFKRHQAGDRAELIHQHSHMLVGLSKLVLKYRLGPRYHHPIELDKAQRAIRLVRVHSSEYGIQVYYEGVPLLKILKRAGAPMETELRGKALASYVLAKAHDGYQVVFTLAEVRQNLRMSR